MALLGWGFSEDKRKRVLHVRVATRVAESHKMVQQSQQGEFYTHSSEPKASGPSETWVKQEIVRRTPRKVAIHMPPKMAHRFERDISNGLSFFASPSPSGLWTSSSCCEGVTRSGSLSDDMAFWE